MPRNSQSELIEAKRIALTEKSWVPLYVVISSMSLAIYGTILYQRICNRIDAGWTINQQQQFVDDLSDLNPGMKVPHLKRVTIDLTAQQTASWP